MVVAFLLTRCVCMSFYTVQNSSRFATFSLNHGMTLQKSTFVMSVMKLSLPILSPSPSLSLTPKM